jgi:histidinol-phosphatase (PHP family)
MLTTYHNHTNWGDGRASLAEMLAAARAAGVDELGISDHYVLYPGGQPVSWSMPLDFLDAYVAAVLAAAATSDAPVLRLGLEADFFPETVATLANRLAPFPFDYLIGSIHFVEGFPVDENADEWEALTVEARDARWRLYWTRVRQLAESRLFDIAGHLDVPKKFGYRPTIDLAAEEAAALEAIAEAGMAIELNTAGWDKPVGEAYPAPRLLRAACRRGIPLVINADAHQPRDLTNHFSRARALAREAGYREVVTYRQRQRTAMPL